MPYLPFRRSASANIVIGSGFSGATDTPTPVGDSGDQGYSAPAIARWSCVPHQTRTGTVSVGVVAFHTNGIASVEFSANGGAWVSVASMTANAESGLYDYNVSIDLTGEDDGLIEVRAVVYPATAGTPLVLQGDYRPSANANPPTTGIHSFYLWSNTSGTYTRTPLYVAATGNDTTGNGTSGNPFLTLSKAAQTLHASYGSLDNCEVRCAAGTYVYNITWGASQESTCSNRWFTVTTAPGVTRSDVTLTYGVHKPKLLRLFEVTCLGSSPNRTFCSEASALGVCYWFDSCTCTSGVDGRWDETSLNFAYGNLYVTDTIWTDTRNGPVLSVMSRNVAASVIGEDAFSRSQSVFNCTVDDIDGGPTDFHSDLYQLFSPGVTFDNYMIYGLSTSGTILAQGFHIKDIAVLRNSAFVNVCFNCTYPDGVLASQVEEPLEHVLMLNCTWKQRIFFLEPDVDENCTFIGNAFEKVLVEDAELAAVTAAKWESNHFVVSTGTSIRTIGSDISTGAWSTVVEDEPAGDFTPIVASPLLGRFSRLVPRDAAGVARPSLSAVGAYERP